MFFISPAPAPIAAPAIAPVVNPTAPHFKAAVPEFFQLPVDILIAIAPLVAPTAAPPIAPITEPFNAPTATAASAVPVPAVATVNAAAASITAVPTRTCVTHFGQPPSSSYMLTGLLKQY